MPAPDGLTLRGPVRHGTVGKDCQPGPNAVEVTVEGLKPVIFTVTAQATPDFDGNGVVGFADFVQFAQQFGLSQSDTGPSARMNRKRAPY